MEASQASVMKPGLPVTITFRDLPGQRYQGRVSRVVTQSQPGGSFGPSGRRAAGHANSAPLTFGPELFTPAATDAQDQDRP